MIETDGKGVMPSGDWLAFGVLNNYSDGVRYTNNIRIDDLEADNRVVIEVLVFNTLANHYQTIPSRYRGDPVSGLIGPVKILVSIARNISILKKYQSSYGYFIIFVP